MAAKDDKAKDDKAPGTKPPDAAMDVQMLKRLLARARSKPVSVAVGQGDTRAGGLGLLLLDPGKPPKALMKMLKDQDPAVTKLCFGTASVDLETDPKLVKLTLNRATPGMERRLRKTLKGTGYTKISIAKAET